ncbi:MAG: hypothetical protein GWN00_18245, partial [Aliifodinibius sp.]|nr:hypothetical protein [Fodinibius sp.]NIV13003.1 hypothetical protein [Fodinibius sp.]NIY26674.1 hypothetical protein [Fodinibius sp.]
MIIHKEIFKGGWFLGAILLLFFIQSASAREKDPRPSMSFNKPLVTQSTRTLSDINNWTYWMQWDGQSGRDPITGASGGFYPGNTLTSTIFADGFIWAGITTDPNASSPVLRAGGSTYISGAVPG